MSISRDQQVEGYRTILKLRCRPLAFTSHNSFRESMQVPLSTLKRFLNRPITKFDNSDDLNEIAAELRRTKTRPTSFY